MALMGAGLAGGVLNVNKAIGWTSHDVVAKLRGILRGPKVGHAGTLDPSATGVLPVLIGRGTRIAEFLMHWDKEYRAVLRLGETTDTQDATGTVLATRPIDALTEASIRSAVARFQGRVAQVPPMYSAVKVGGVPLYKTARAGRTIMRGPRDVMVHTLEVLSIAGRDVALRIVCSKGTYVRTLCADIGEALGVGGHLLTLERRRVGPLTIEHALTVEEVGTRFLLGRLAEDLLSLDKALERLPALVVDKTTAGRVLHGVPVPARAAQWTGAAGASGLTAGQVARIKNSAGCLLALGKVAIGGMRAGVPEEIPEQPVAILKVLVDPSEAG